MTSAVRPRHLLHRWPKLLGAAAVAAGAALLLFPLAGLSAKANEAAALTVATMGLWATGALPEHLTAILFFLAAMLLQVAPAPVVFSGFASAALWLIFGGLVVGVAVRTTGLGRRIARQVARRFERNYALLITGVVGLGVLFGFLMPSSMGRVILLIPITLAIAEHFGFGPGSNGRLAIVMAAAFATHVSTFAILPANVPNMVLFGSAQTLYSVALLYGQYLLLHFPVLGLVKSVLLVGLILWLFPDRMPAVAPEAPASAPLSGGERKLAWVLAAALALWMTDSLHHISPAWVALGAAVVLLWPGFGVVSGEQFNRELNYGSLFFVAGVMGLGAVVSHTGLGDRLAGALLALAPLSPGHPARDFATLGFTSFATGMVTTLPGVPAVLTPLAGKMAQASGLPLKTVLMTQVVGFSTPLLPYQSAPLLVGMQLAGERVAPATRLLVALSLLTVLLLWPLDYLWWHLLGWI